MGKLISMLKSLFTPKPLAWEAYMGDWKEFVDIPKSNDSTLYKITKCIIPKHDYNTVLTIRDSKQQYGNPNLIELCNLLIFHCAEIEKLRNKPNLGYYADCDELWARGYRSISGEDVKHIEGVLLHKVQAATEVDFILSSPGGNIAATAELMKTVRKKFNQLSFLLPGSAYSGATMLALTGDEIIMQSFMGHLAPINPMVNGFDTYIGKQMLRTCNFYSIVAPWAVKHLAEAQIKGNNVTKKTMVNLERFVVKTAKFYLGGHMFKVDKLPLVAKLKTKYKISKIVNFLSDFKRHLSHQIPFFSQELINVGMPVKNAEQPLDDQLRIIRNICEEITQNAWNDGSNEFFIRKIYFSGQDCYYLCYVAHKNN
jgi:hypothetical protein